MAFDTLAAHPETTMPDVALRFGDYTPKNFDGHFRGQISAREALQAIALFRLVLPSAWLRLAGGRELVLGELQAMGMVAGANAVQVGTINFVDPFIWTRLLDGIRSYLQRHGIARVSDLTGTIDTTSREKEWISS